MKTVFALVGWLASCSAADSFSDVLHLSYRWPFVGYDMTNLMGTARLLAIASTFFVAVALGEYFRFAVWALGVVCLAAGLLSQISRADGIVGRYIVFGISVFAVGFGLFKAGQRIAGWRRVSAA